MARILAISSQVVRGHVGLSAIVPALQRLGHEVLAIPTIILSNHPGHVRAAGTRIEVSTLTGILDVLDANGWLASLDAVMTGYLPSKEHVAFAARAIELVRKRSPETKVIVDPVLGDDPRGLYVEVDVARAIRDQLVPLSDILLPNRFELQWLTDRAVDDCQEAVRAARTLLADRVVVTSIPHASELANVAITRTDARACPVEKLSRVPHGTGDFLSGLYVGHVMRGSDPDLVLGLAVAGVRAAVEISIGASDLILSDATPVPCWISAAPLPDVEVPNA
jgi:pyridoxine kinase